MALRFGKKKPAEGGGDGNGSFEPQPEKARKWFEHAKSMADRYSYDSALFYYANGVRLSPTTMSAHEAMYEAGVQYCNRGGKPATGKELKQIEGAHPVEKFAAAEFAWLKDVNNASLALKFLESTVKAVEWAGEVGRWHAPRVLSILRRQKKPSKSTFLNVRDHLAELGAWDEAIAAGEDALQLDPQDAELQADLQALAAQRAMDQGGYEAAGGEEGGFRKFVKDADRQRELEEKDSIAGGKSLDERNLERAAREYEESPQVPDVLNRYAQLLKATGDPANEEKAHAIFMKGYEDTGQYRFRAAAGDVRIEQAQVRHNGLIEQLQRDGESSELKTRLAEARTALLDLRQAEFTARVREYPTDRKMKHQLGEVQFERGRYDEAMKCFQEAKDDPKLRVRAGYLLARCFAAESWHDIAIQEYKEALGRVEAGDKDTELAIRYDLMVSLIAQAAAEESLDLAREALEICSSIARKDISYRDIRKFRKDVDELTKRLSG